MGGAVVVEDVFAAVDVGGAEAELEEAAFSDGEFAFDTEVETVVVGQTSAVEVGIVDAVMSVFLGVVADDATAEDEALEDSLGLREGEAAAETPTGADFPLALTAEGVGAEDVDGMAAVVVGVVGLNLVLALYVAEGVGGPEVEPFEVGLDADVEAGGEALLDDEVGEEVFGFGVGT